MSAMTSPKKRQTSDSMISQKRSRTNYACLSNCFLARYIPKILADGFIVRQEKIKDLKLKFKPHYLNTYSGTADLYDYFYDRALQLLKKQGSLAFITSNKWFRAAYGERLREHWAASHFAKFMQPKVYMRCIEKTVAFSVDRQNYYGNDKTCQVLHCVVLS